MNRERSWQRVLAIGATAVTLAVLTPELARAATVEGHRHAAPTRVQQVRSETAQVRPAAEARHWGGERAESRNREWHDGHRDYDRGYVWGRPYWGPPAWGWAEPYVARPAPGPIYVPGQWTWNGWGWVWQPGYWSY